MRGSKVIGVFTAVDFASCRAKGMSYGLRSTPVSEPRFRHQSYISCALVRFVEPSRSVWKSHESLT